MGRREKPVDPSAGPVPELAHALRELRARAGGPTYREMARSSGYSVTALSRAAAGEALPSLAVTLAYAAACGGDREVWEERWRAVHRRVAAAPADDARAAGPAPYQGLAPFDVADSGRFFGRERTVQDLRELAQAHRCVLLFGPSGSGKSSLLRAGLLAGLREPAEPTPTEPTEPTAPTRHAPAALRILTPGPRPLDRHAKLFVPAPGEGDTWLVVDQFEEVFTLCADAEQRTGFIDLVTSAAEPGSRLRVVLGVRADFYAHCLAHHGLARAARDASLPVGPMTPAEIRAAVVRPATEQGLIVERALTSRLVDEVGQEPGGLPLLSHVLLETWRRRRGRSLTLDSYEAAGGLRGAIAQTAEDAYRRLTPVQARLARRVLLRLVTPGEGAPDTRRPTPRVEFHGGPADGTGDIDAVLETLARARLITLDDDVVDLAHEALIAGWPRLRGWIEDDRERLLAHRKLTEAAETWRSLDRDPGALYRGTRLSHAEDLFGGEGTRTRRAASVRRRSEPPASDELTATEREFLGASVAARDAERRAAARRDRAVRLLAAGLAGLLAVVTGITLYAVDERRDALRERRLAQSRQLAAQALRLAPSRPATAKLLSVAAYRTAATPQARGALLTMAAYAYHRGELTGHRDAVSEVAFAGDGRTLASVSRDRRVLLWDARRQTRLATLDGHRTWLRALAVSRDGRTLASGGDDGKVVLWDIRTQRRTAAFGGHTGPVKSIAFSPDGRLVASSAADGTVRVRATADGAGELTLRGHRGDVPAVVFSPDGRQVASAGHDGTVRLWGAADGRARATLRGHAGTVTSLAFAPDGRTLASGGDDTSVLLWDTAAERRTATLKQHSGQVKAVAFGPDGRQLASAGLDRTVLLWDVRQRTRTATLTGHGTNVYGLAYAPAAGTASGTGGTGPRAPGRAPLLASAGENGAITLWDPSKGALAGHEDRINEARFSPDGRTLATAGDDGSTALWDLRTGSRAATLRERSGPANSVAFAPDGSVATASGASLHPPRPGAVTVWRRDSPRGPGSWRAAGRFTGHAERVLDVAFSPDGRLLASASSDGTAVLWDPERWRSRAVLRHTAAAADGRSADRRGVNAVAFSPDGRTLATAGHDSRTLLWDVASGRLRATLTGHTGSLRAVAFSPDGRTVAAAGMGRKVLVWDAESGRRVAALAGESTVLALAFTPDGRTLAAADADTSVTLWDTASARPRAILTGHSRQVRALAFSPDGRTLASAGVDGTAVLWGTDAEGSARGLCATAVRELTRAEWSRLVPDSPYRRICPRPGSG